MVDMEEFSKELLRYGSIIIDDEFNVETFYTYTFNRIRIILYNNKIYYHKIINQIGKGEIVEIKEIGNAKEIAVD